MPTGHRASAESPTDTGEQLVDAFRRRDKATRAYREAAKAWHDSQVACDTAAESLATCLEQAEGEQGNFAGTYSATLRWSEQSQRWLYNPIGSRQLPPGQYGIGLVVCTVEGSRVRLIGSNRELWYEADIRHLQLLPDVSPAPS